MTLWVVLFRFRGHSIVRRQNSSAPFNCFREENPTNLEIAPYNADFPYKDIDPIVEKEDID